MDAFDWTGVEMNNIERVVRLDETGGMTAGLPFLDPTSWSRSVKPGSDGGAPRSFHESHAFGCQVELTVV